MYEATKRATQDITTHAKEAMQRTGLKDVSEGVSGGQGLRAVGCRVRAAVGDSCLKWSLRGGTLFAHHTAATHPPTHPPCRLQVKQMASNGGKAAGEGVEGMAASLAHAVHAAGDKLEQAAQT